MEIEEVDYSKRARPLYCLDAMDYIDIIYSQGLINWNVFQKVMEKIRTNMNGSWMFESKVEEKDKK